MNITVRLFFIFLMVFFPLSGFSKEEPKFIAEDIPAELKDNARSVIRYSNHKLEILSSKKAKYTVSWAITILNENGLQDSYLKELYDKHIKLKNITGKVYDKHGKQIERLALSELEDYSAISGYSTFDDTRIKVYDPKVFDYPFTVEYQVENHIDGYINLPGWQPYLDYNIAIENSAFELSYPVSMDVRYLQNNVEMDSENIVDGINVLKWKVDNLQAIEYEVFSAPYFSFEPSVMVAPDNFEFDGYEGSLKSWRELGKWIYKLAEDRDNISEELRTAINAMVSDTDTDRNKICAIYKYMQDNTRYVSVQLGIGGYQPFEANTVERLKYGDCKALTNYMQVLLDAAEIKSYYTLVGAGSYEDPTLREFPSNQFNHAFLCVPLENDTLWLECTNQKAPCGYIGDFTDDRDVLVIDESGGKLVRTPGYTAEGNRKSTYIEAELYENGNASLQINATYHGPYMDEVFEILSYDNKDKEKELYERLDLTKSIIRSYNHQIIDEPPYIGKETIQLDVGNVAVSMGKNLFLNPNLFNQLSELRGKPEERKTDIFIRRSFSNVDTIVYKLPDKVVVSALPKPVSMENDFGMYTCSFSESEGKILYTRYFELKKGEFPKERIHELYDFVKEIAASDKKRLALKIN